MMANVPFSSVREQNFFARVCQSEGRFWFDKEGRKQGCMGSEANNFDSQQSEQNINKMIDLDHPIEKKESLDFENRVPKNSSSF